MFQGQYPPFTLDSNGAVIVTNVGSTTPTKGQYPPFTLDSNGAIICTVV